MTLKSRIALLFAHYIDQKTQKWANNPVQTQQKVFLGLIRAAKNTKFGQDHHFQEILNPSDFAANVPVRDYEQLRNYVDLVVQGQSNILWPGLPLYFAKTSGTTSGAKFIPLTRESMPTHITAARNAILSYIHETKKADFVNGKMIFLQGSPELELKNGIKLGRLSGIVAHFVPKYLQRNRLPSWETNIIDDWETKVNAVVQETFDQNMTVISGIPSWVQMYFEKLQQKTNQPIGELFPSFNLFIYGGVNYEPYRAKFENLIGRKVDSIELFPASEGFFAYQNQQNDPGMLLLLDSGIFYEFIKTSDFYSESPQRYTVGDVELETNYVLIISTSAGLWAYNIGDTVMFTSLRPLKLVVTGRIKHFISAFGEHVIGKEVETALSQSLLGTNIRVNEFTVAPQITPSSGLPYHEWFIEFENAPENLENFALQVDQQLCAQNSYYKDLIDGKVLRTLQIAVVPAGGFQRYMKSVGRLGGQNKMPRLSNDRKIVEVLG